MPPKKASPAASPTRSSSKKPRKKKGPSTDKAKQIITLRDSLLAKASTDDEKLNIGMACQGMYKCDKAVDDQCLDGILAKLNKLKKGGGKRRSRSKSKSRTKSRSKSRRR